MLTAIQQNTAKTVLEYLHKNRLFLNMATVALVLRRTGDNLDALIDMRGDDLAGLLPETHADLERLGMRIGVLNGDEVNASIEVLQAASTVRAHDFERMPGYAEACRVRLAEALGRSLYNDGALTIVSKPQDRHMLTLATRLRYVQE